MNRLLNVIAAILLAVSAYAQSGDGKIPPPTNFTVSTLGGTANNISLFSGKKTIANSVIFQNGSNVGVGTTAPSSTLTVNGSIQSLVGGFTFPDKSVQSTAGLTTVSHDGNYNGTGSAASPLTVAAPLTLSTPPFTDALIATSNGGTALSGTDISQFGFGVEGNVNDGYGVSGGAGSDYGIGVGGFANGQYGVGVYGWEQQTGGVAVYGIGYSGYAWAGWFEGDVNVTGNLSKSGGSFKIDDPVDPANKYLYHSFVESPDMKNMYDGTVTTDAAGDATVRLPHWFQALNSTFRYQLTPIGQFAQAIVATEVQNNQFTIRTDKPYVKVSWQVTGTRQDAWAKAHRIPVEVDKPEDERGYYIHPELFGAGPEKNIMAAHRPGDFAPGGPRHRH